MYEALRTIHLITVTPCIFIGFCLIYISRKGSNLHELFGKTYLALMFIQASISLFMEAKVGPQFLKHFGWIHLLSIITIATIPYSLYAIKKGFIKSHSRSMIILFWSGLIIAGGFTLVPGRYLNEVLFN